MSGGVFICYRREETAFAARAIHDRVVQRLERESVFLDVDNIDLGVDWFNVLTERVGARDALVAVIGRNWVSNADKDGLRRIDDPDDFVRIEIEAALQRNVRVIPVLVDGAAMPKASELPESLKGLARRQGTVVSHAGFEADVEKLTRALVSILDDRRRREAAEAERLAREEEARRAEEGAKQAAENEAARRREEERAARKAPERAETRAVAALKEGSSQSKAAPPRLWDPAGGPPSFIALEGHKSGLYFATFSPDGTHVFTASGDTTARVWDLRGKQPSFVALEGYWMPLYTAAFSSDGTHVVTATYETRARVWNLQGYRPSFVALEGHQSWVDQRRSAQTEPMSSPRQRTRRRGCGICGRSSRASSPWKAMRVKSSRPRTARTEPVWSPRQRTRRRWCGICGGSSRASSSEAIRIGNCGRRSARTEPMSSQRQMT